MTRFTLTRRALACAAAATFGALALSPSAVLAADYPKTQVRLVLNFPAGGPLDILARQLAPRLAASLGQPFVVENVTGAAGQVGAAAVARAQPDGHTVLLSIDSPFTSSPWLMKQMPYPLEALRPINILGSTGLTLAVHPSAPFKTMAELIERGRREEITFSSPGPGGPGHFGALLLSDATGIKVNAVHYRGNAPAVTALLSGEVQAGMLGTTSLLQHIKAGKVRVLAAASRQRSSLMPELPTLAELGYPKFTLQTLFVVMVPARTPEPVVQALNEALGKAMREPELQQQLRALDIAPGTQTPQESAATLAQAREDYKRLVQAAGMQPE